MNYIEEYLRDKLHIVYTALKWVKNMNKIILNEWFDY